MSVQHDIAWQFLGFDELTTDQLYGLLQLRSEVFVVEQACVFQDLDGNDRQALHLLGTQAGSLLAYARCFAPGEKYAEASIGRVITHASQRGTGLGHVLMQTALHDAGARWGYPAIRIGAQARLEHFYGQYDFVRAGAPYIEDGIAHIEMLRPARDALAAQPFSKTTHQATS